MKFSRKEIKEMVKAWFFVSLAFAILFSGGFKVLFSFSLNFFLVFLISGFTVGITFLFHELAHKFLAERYGYNTEFIAFNKMLFLGLIMSLFGFIFIVPGGVIIKTLKISREKNGKISLAGPLTNFVFALFFILLLFVFKLSGFFETFFVFGLKINSLFALFNLIPVLGFDGKKVFNWDKAVWSLVFILSLILFTISFFLI